MTTKANAIYRARNMARQRQETIYVVYDPSALDQPSGLAYYPALKEEVDTFYQDCEIVDAVDPEDILS